jgi:hypothetical protein
MESRYLYVAIAGGEALRGKNDLSGFSGSGEAHVSVFPRRPSRGFQLGVVATVRDRVCCSPKFGAAEHHPTDLAAKVSINAIIFRSSATNSLNYP